MKSKSLSLVVGLLALAFCPSFSHAGLIPFSVEVGVLGGYLPEVPTEIEIENPDDPLATIDFKIDGAAFFSAYGFLGFDVFDPPAVTATLEVMLLYNLVDESFSDLDVIGLLDDADVETDFSFERAYGVGARLSFGFLGLIEAYARGGYTNFAYAVEKGRITGTLGDTGTLEDLKIEKLTSSDWGVYFGAGMKVGLMTFGYFYFPKLEDAHVLTVGFRFF